MVRFVVEQNRLVGERNKNVDEPYSYVPQAVVQPPHTEQSLRYSGRIAGYIHRSQGLGHLTSAWCSLTSQISLSSCANPLYILLRT